MGRAFTHPMLAAARTKQPTTLAKGGSPSHRRKLAQLISMFSSVRAWLNRVIPRPPLDSGLETRSTVCLSE